MSLFARIKTFIGNLRLRERMLFIYIAGGILPILLLDIYTYQNTRSVLIQKAKESEMDGLNMIADSMSESMSVISDISKQMYFDEKIEHIAFHQYENYSEILADYRDYDTISDYLKYYYHEISSITLYLNNDTISNNEYFVHVDQEIAEKPWYQNTLELNGKPYWSYSYDLNAFRYDGQNDGDPGEVRALAAADKILAPNVNTVSMLKKNGISSDMIPVGIWDYRMNETQIAKIREISHAHKKENAVKIAFAGNLNKSEFLSAMEIPSDVRMELWGKLDPEREKTLAEGCHYHGILSSDEIPFAVGEMDYGLVWDGSGKDEIEGGLGEYLRYNNSHKCALYLASGIPVIVWSRSGMANFVREHACGITIDRLGDLDQAIHTADYEKLKEAALAVAPKLWEGYYLSQAIDSACG